MRLRLGSELRSRWRAWLALAVLVGLFAGAVIAAAAGARRTETSYKRFLAAERAPDILVFAPPATNETDTTFASLSEEQLAGLPGAAAVGEAATVGVARPNAFNIIAPADGRIGSTILRRKMLAGRLPRRDSLDEATVSFVLASARHVHVGDRLHLDALAAAGGTKPFTFKVVGIDAAPTEFPPQEGTGVQAIWTSPAFYRAEVGGLVSYATTAVRLRHGLRDFAAFQAGARALADGKVIQSFPLADQAVNTQHSIHLQAVALWMLAALLGITGVLVLTQLLTRQSVLESAEYPSLRALGMGRLQLWVLGALRGAAVGVVGAAAAVVVAYALSPLMPIGLARTAEPHPGLAFDVRALALGALATAVLVALAASWPAWRAVAGVGAADENARSRPSALANVLARPSTSAPVITGVRLALERGRGRTAVPVRSTIAGAVVGVAALAAALAFTSSLDHLLGSPRLYGASFDARIESLTGGDDVTPAADVAVKDSRVEGVSIGYAGFPVTIAKHRVDGIALEAMKGATLMPTPLSGRTPASPDEIMLGPSTMATLHAHIGATVRATVADSSEPISFRVVGEGVFPSLSDAMGLGKGIAMLPDGLTRALPPGADAPPRDHALIQFRPGTDIRRAVSDLERQTTAAFGTGIFVVETPDKPVDLINFGRVQSLPLVLAALLGTLAAITLAHLMVTSIRRRRRDLAVLKTLGFSSRQVRSTVAWQATVLAFVAAVIGIPVGLICGRWVWIVFSHQLGIVPRPTVPFLTFLFLAAAAVVVANLVAVLPGRAAARLQPAPVLRSE